MSSFFINIITNTITKPIPYILKVNMATVWQVHTFHQYPLENDGISIIRLESTTMDHMKILWNSINGQESSINFHIDDMDTNNMYTYLSVNIFYYNYIIIFHCQLIYTCDQLRLTPFETEWNSIKGDECKINL